MVLTVRSPSPTCYRLPIYNLVSFDYNLTFSQTAAILDSIMVSIVVLSNYGDVKQIYVNKIREKYIITRQINLVFALYKVVFIITETFSKLFLVHGGHLE